MILQNTLPSWSFTFLPPHLYPTLPTSWSTHLFVLILFLCLPTPFLILPILTPFLVVTFHPFLSYPSTLQSFPSTLFDPTYIYPLLGRNFPPFLSCPYTIQSFPPTLFDPTYIYPLIGRNFPPFLSYPYTIQSFPPILLDSTYTYPLLEPNHPPTLILPIYFPTILYSTFQAFLNLPTSLSYPSFIILSTNPSSSYSWS